MMSELDRRKFLKTSTMAAAAAVAAPSIVPQGAFGANDRLNLGLIGCGGRGNWLARHFSELGECVVVAACDVDRSQLEKGVERVNTFNGNRDCRSYTDFRELLESGDVDAVIVATPDHWHGLAGITSAEAGKHIYCEKPLCNSIGESKALRDTIIRTGVKLQTGSHERSRDNARYCVELVRNGYIGELKEIQVNLPTNQDHHNEIRRHEGTPPELPVPEGLNWDMWLGHTPEIPYYDGLQPFGWRFNLSFGCGEMSDRGAHVIDIAQFGNDSDNSGPIEAEARGWDDANGIYNAPMEFGFTNLYANGVRMYGGTTANPRGVRFVGEEGWIFLRIHEGTLEASDSKLLEIDESRFGIQLGRSYDHVLNFVGAVKGRNELFAPVEVGHRSCCACLINMMAMKLRRRLQWDPVKEEFINDDEANRLMNPEMRKPWTV
jgi:predicted dehydrogenase